MNPMTSNSDTLNAYNNNLRAYIEGTPQEVTGSVQEWIEETLSYIHRNAKILEIGSGFGRDADYIESRGFLVERSDAADSFVECLRNQGHETKHFNVLEESIPVTYDLIYANAVFLHFREEELKIVLNTVYKGLNETGILAFSVKLGQGEMETPEKVNALRYFRFWQPQPLEELVMQHGFRILQSRCDGKFIQLITQKV